MTKLATLRLQKGYSQNDLAIASGVHKRTIQSYEQGTRSIEGASLEILCSLAMSLECHIEDILENPKLIERYKIVK